MSYAFCQQMMNPTGTTNNYKINYIFFCKDQSFVETQKMVNLNNC